MKKNEEKTLKDLVVDKSIYVLKFLPKTGTDTSNWKGGVVIIWFSPNRFTLKVLVDGKYVYHEMNNKLFQSWDEKYYVTDDLDEVRTV